MLRENAGNNCGCNKPIRYSDLRKSHGNKRTKPIIYG